MSKRGKLLVGAGAAAVIAGLVVISAAARRDRGAEVRFEKVGHRDLVAAVTASGRIQPKKKVDISADITGRITRIAVREGDLVTKGQFLLQIDPTVYQANLQQAEATLASSQAAAVQAKANRDQAERALKRTRELRDQNPNLISPEQLLAADRSVRAAGLEVLGFFHSHPDHPPEPSSVDRENGWPWYSYLIVSVERGRIAGQRAWRLREDRTSFDAEPIETPSVDGDGVLR